MNHLLLATLNRLQKQTASKGDVFNEGDRVAVNYDEDDPKGSWYVGTVAKGRAGRIAVVFDNGEKESYAAAEGQTEELKILDPKTPKTRKELKLADVKKLLRKGKPKPVAPKPAATRAPVTKTVVTPKTKAPVSITRTPKVPASDADLARRIWETENDTYRNGFSAPITQDVYEALPYLGVRFNTGRRGPTSVAVAIGIYKSAKYNKSALISYCPQRGDILASNSYIGSYYDGRYTPPEGALRSGTKLSYVEYMRYRKAADEKTKDIHQKRSDFNTKSNEQHRALFDKIYQLGASNMEALIRFTNGPKWVFVHRYDAAKQQMGIAGSGSKLRWISFAHILDVRARSM